MAVARLGIEVSYCVVGIVALADLIKALIIFYGFHCSCCHGSDEEGSIRCCGEHQEQPSIPEEVRNLPQGGRLCGAIDLII